MCCGRMTTACLKQIDTIFPNTMGEKTTLRTANCRFALPNYNAEPLFQYDPSDKSKRQLTAVGKRAVEEGLFDCAVNVQLFSTSWNRLCWNMIESEPMKTTDGDTFGDVRLGYNAFPVDKLLSKDFPVYLRAMLSKWKDPYKVNSVSSKIISFANYIQIACSNPETAPQSIEDATKVTNAALRATGVDQKYIDGPDAWHTNDATLKDTNVLMIFGVPEEYADAEIVDSYDGEEAPKKPKGLKRFRQFLAKAFFAPYTLDGSVSDLGMIMAAMLRTPFAESEGEFPLKTINPSSASPWTEDLRDKFVDLGNAFMANDAAKLREMDLWIPTDLVIDLELDDTLAFRFLSRMHKLLYGNVNGLRAHLQLPNLLAAECAVKRVAADQAKDALKSATEKLEMANREFQMANQKAAKAKEELQEAEKKFNDGSEKYPNLEDKRMDTFHRSLWMNHYSNPGEVDTYLFMDKDSENFMKLWKNNTMLDDYRKFYYRVYLSEEHLTTR